MINLKYNEKEKENATFKENTLLDNQLTGKLGSLKEEAPNSLQSDFKQVQEVDA